MARAAVSGRLTWRVATLADARWETPTARTLVFDVPDWPGHLAGQHVDVRLTAPDGYRAQRSYSIASAWEEPITGSSEDGGGSGARATLTEDPGGSGRPPQTEDPGGSGEPSQQTEDPGGNGRPPQTEDPGGGGRPPQQTEDPGGSGERLRLSDNDTAGRFELSVQRLDDGEVSPYLTDTLEIGDQIELRGPVGGWFVWREQTAPVLLIGGGSGVVPLMAMIRARALAGGKQPFRLIYSVRTPADAWYGGELARRVRDDAGLDVRYVYTRRTPEGWPAPAKRIDVATVNTYGWPPDFAPDCYVCGPTSFVETVADILVALGHDPKRIRTERFGGA